MTKFKVLSLDWTSFAEACAKLRLMVDKSGYFPDVVVGIPRGGCYLVDQGWSDCETLSIEILKPDGFSLKNKIGRLVRLLPLTLRDGLRIWEAKRLIRRTGHMASVIVNVPKLPKSVKRVLLVDDALDSGATFASVVNAFKSVNPEVEIKSLCITITGNRPLYKTDYYLYNDSTLVRMPWSIDAKQ